MQRTAPFLLNERAEAAALGLPPLLVEAERIAATVILGVHGRKRAGPGESFWQYRPYSFGDSTQRIDWHKSARADRVFIRENEWEAANSLWLWASPGPGMAFRSHLSAVTKRDRAAVVALALGSLAVRAQERVALIGAPFAPGHAKSQLVRMADFMMRDKGSALPALARLPRFASAALIGDFYEPLPDIAAALTPLAASGATGHVVQVCDPAEETLPYEGRMEFHAVEGPAKFLAGKTESLRDAYGEKFRAHREGLRELVTRLGWTLSVHRTDQPPARLLMMLHGLIGGAKSRAFNHGGMA
jgi:uncharacterized protein (DUF58 family)